MDHQDILSQATAIARTARASQERPDLEETVREFEQSGVPVLRNLARTYRMLQNPYQ